MSTLLAGMLVAVALGARGGHRQEEPQKFIEDKFSLSNDLGQYFLDTSIELAKTACPSSISLEKVGTMHNLRKHSESATFYYASYRQLNPEDFLSRLKAMRSFERAKYYGQIIDSCQNFEATGFLVHFSLATLAHKERSFEKVIFQPRPGYLANIGNVYANRLALSYEFESNIKPFMGGGIPRYTNIYGLASFLLELECFSIKNKKVSEFKLFDSHGLYKGERRNFLENKPRVHNFGKPHFLENAGHPTPAYTFLLNYVKAGGEVGADFAALKKGVMTPRTAHAPHKHHHRHHHKHRDNKKEANHGGDHHRQRRGSPRGEHKGNDHKHHNVKNAVPTGLDDVVRTERRFPEPKNVRGVSRKKDDIPSETSDDAYYSAVHYYIYMYSLL